MHNIIFCFKTSFCLWAPSASRIFLGSKLQQVPSSQALLPLRSCQYLLGWGLNCRSFSHFTTKQTPAKNKNIPHSFRIEPFVLRIFWIFFHHSQYSPPVFTSPPAKTKTSIMSPLHSKMRQRPSKLALAWLGNEWIPRNMLEESQQIRVPLEPLVTRQVIQTNRSDLSFLGFPIILLCFFYSPQSTLKNSVEP